jgi:hypothetical protein
MTKVKNLIVASAVLMSSIAFSTPGYAGCFFGVEVENNSESYVHLKWIALRLDGKKRWHRQSFDWKEGEGIDRIVSTFEGKPVLGPRGKFIMSGTNARKADTKVHWRIKFRAADNADMKNASDLVELYVPGPTECHEQQNVKVSSGGGNKFWKKLSKQAKERMEALQ